MWHTQIAAAVLPPQREATLLHLALQALHGAGAPAVISAIGEMDAHGGISYFK